MSKTINIILVDDHRLVIEGLTLLLEDQNHIHILQSFFSGKELLDYLPDHHHEVDLIFLDLKMPGISGLECVTTIKSQFPDIKIAILSMEDDADLIYRLLNHYQVNAYLSKGIRRKELLDAIYQIMNNNLYISDDIEKILNNYRIKLIEQDQLNLTAREKEVADLMCKGLTNEKIADKLFISVATVATHRKNIYRKTDTHNIGQLNEKLK